MVDFNKLREKKAAKPSVKQQVEQKSEAIERREDGAIQAAPEYVTGMDSRDGFEEVRPGDVKIPRLSLAQALSPQLAVDTEGYIKDLKPGDFFNTSTWRVYGRKVFFIPLLKFGVRILFKNMDEGGGILCQSRDMVRGQGEPGGACARCPLAQFGSARNGEGKGTACSEFYNFPSLIAGEDGQVTELDPVMISMKSSHIAAAQKLIGLANRRRQHDGSRAPMYVGVYSATSVQKAFTEKLRAFVPVIDNAGWVGRNDVQLAQECYKAMRELREQERLVTEFEAPEREPGEDVVEVPTNGENA